MSVEIVNEIWKLDEPQYFRDTSIDQRNFFKCFPSQGFQIAPTQTEATFRLSDLNNWYIPSQSQIEIEATVTSRNIEQPTTFTNDIRVAMFDSYDLQINSTTIEQQSRDLDVWCCMDRSLYNHQYSRYDASNWGFYPYDDSVLPAQRLESTGVQADGMFLPALYKNPDFEEVADFSASAKSGLANYAFLIQTSSEGKRRLISQRDNSGAGDRQLEGRKMTFWVPLVELSSFFRQFSRATRGLDMQINLKLHSTQKKMCQTAPRAFVAAAGVGDVANALVKPGEDHGVLSWKKAVWWIPNVKPSPATEARLNTMLQSGLEVPVLFERPQVYYNSGINSVGENNWRVVCESSRPTRLCFTMRPKVAQTNQAQPTDKFSLAKLSDFQVFLNGLAVPNARIQFVDPDPTGAGNDAGGGAANVDGSWNIAELPDQDMAQLFYYYQTMALQNKEAYLRNYSLGASHQNITTWRTWNPAIWVDLSPGSVGDITTSSSEIVLNYTTTDSLQNMDLYCIVYTEREVRMSLSNASTYISIR